MSPSSPTISALPWLVTAWIVTVVVVATATLMYLIARAVLDKTEPQKLPEVLRALTPLLNGVARALTHLATGLPPDERTPADPPITQTGDTTAEPAEEAS